MKRFGVIFCIFALLIACCLPVAAVSFPTDTANTDYEDAVNMLVAFGIFDVDEGKLFQPKVTMTRAQFVSTVVKMKDPDSGAAQSLTGENVFIDVSEEDWWSGPILLALDLGLIDGTGNGRFEPDEPILYEHAVKILVRLLGYEHLAEQSGYMVVADSVGLLKGLSLKGTDYVTKGAAALLIANALEADALEPASYQPNEGYVTYKKENFAKSAMGIQTDKGVVTANEVTPLALGSPAPKESVIINGVTYQQGEMDAADFLGYRVKVYYSEENGERVIRYITKTANEELTISAEDIIRADGDKVYYENSDSNRERSAKISKNANYIYNGKVPDTYESGILTPQQGYLKLVDNDSDGVFDVVFAVHTEDIVVLDKNEDTYMIYDAVDPQLQLELAPDKEAVYIRDSEGNAMEFADIKAMDVLTVQRSMDDQVITCQVSREFKSGILGQVEKSESGEIDITVSDIAYSLTPKYAQYVTEKNMDLPIGASVKVYFNAQGKVAYLDFDTQSVNRRGFLINAKEIRGGFGNVEFRILDEDGEIGIFQCADRIQIDGISYKNSSSVVEAVSLNGAVNNVPILYRQNSAGEIIYLDMPADSASQRETGSQLFRANAKAEKTYSQTNRAFDYKVNLTSETLIFVVPDSDIPQADDVYFGVSTMSTFVGNSKYTIASYQTDDESMNAEILVLYRASDEKSLKFEKDTEIATITDKTQVVRDGQVTTKLTVLFEGGTRDLYPTDESVFHNVPGNLSSYVYQELEIGDVIMYATRVDGLVGKVNVIVGTPSQREGSTSTDPKEIAFSPRRTTDRSLSPHFMYGSVYLKDDDRITLTFDDPQSVSPDDLTKMESRLASAYRITVVDMSEGKTRVEKGSVADITDYCNYMEPSTVLVQDHYGEARCIVVFKFE